MYSQVLVVVFICVAGSHGFFNPHGSWRPERAMCTLPTKPCRLQVTMRHFNGTLEGSMETETCTCNHPYSCSDDWSDSEHVISRNLISNTYNMTLNMMFCRPVQPPRYCSLGEEALVVSGALSIPQNVESFNCRCIDGTPLLLHQRRIGSDHLVYHTYVCDYHKATCPRRISHCLVSSTEESNYTCKCPSGLHCRTDESYWTDITYGYCRP